LKSLFFQLESMDYLKLHDTFCIATMETHHVEMILIMIESFIPKEQKKVQFKIWNVFLIFTNRIKLIVVFYLKYFLSLQREFKRVLHINI